MPGFVGRKTLSDDRFRSLEDEPGDLSCGESGEPVFPFGATCHESCMERAIRQRQPLRAPESDPLQSTFQSRNSLGCKQFRFRIETSYTATRNSRDYNLPAVAKKWTSGRHAGGFDNILFVDGHAGCFNIAKLVDHVSFLYSAFMPDSEDIGSPLRPC